MDLRYTPEEEAQEFSEAGVAARGVSGTLLEEDESAVDRGTRYLSDPSYPIAGGTSEIQRNIVAERIPGLPRRSLFCPGYRGCACTE